MNSKEEDNNLLGDFCYIKITALPPNKPRRTIPWPGLLIPKIPRGSFSTSKNETTTTTRQGDVVDRVIRDIKILRETYQLLSVDSNSSSSTAASASPTIDKPYDHYCAIYLFGSPPTKKNVLSFDRQKVMPDNKDIPFRKAVEDYHDVEGYKDACVEAQLYVEGEDDNDNLLSAVRHNHDVDTTGTMVAEECSTHQDPIYNAYDDSDEEEEEEEDGATVVHGVSKADCLTVFGSPKEIRNHPGNIMFRQLIAKYAEAARASEDKNPIIRAVKDKFAKTGGRFMKPTAGMKLSDSIDRESWVQVDEKAVWLKIRDSLKNFKPHNEQRLAAGTEKRSRSKSNGPSQRSDGYASNSSHRKPRPVKRWKMSDERSSHDASTGNETGYVLIDPTADAIVNVGEPLATPGQMDCASARGWTNHPGNARFTKLIHKHSSSFQGTDRAGRMQIVAQVMNEFGADGSRILRQPARSKLWVDFPRKAIREKIQKALGRKRTLDTADDAGSSDGHSINGDYERIPLFKRLQKLGATNFFYESFRYTHLQHIPEFDDVRETLEKAGHSFSNDRFTMPDGSSFTSEIEYRKKMCLDGVLVKGIRPRDIKDDVDFQILMAWVCYVRLEELARSKTISSSKNANEDGSLGVLLSRLERLDEDGKFFGDMEKLARQGVDPEAVDKFNLSKEEHMQLERYYSCPYSRFLENALFFHK